MERNCKTCRKNCDNKNYEIPGFTIFSKSHCPIEQLEKAKEIVYCNEFKSLLDKLDDTACLYPLKKQMEVLIKMSQAK